MKKILILIFILFFGFFMQNAYAQNSNEKTQKVKKSYTEREYQVTTSDGHIINAYLTYPKTKLKGYPTVLMLHSLGYNSRYWASLQKLFNNNGYAVVRIDFRGHGKSVYDKSFHQRSWRSYKNDTFVKYPKDVIETLNYIKNESKKVDFNNNWVIIGSGIGANSAVIVARDFPTKPKALVLMGASMSFKGIYIPVALTEIGKMPILAIASKTDNYYMQEQVKLARFAQGRFDICDTDSGSSGMLLITQHPNIQSTIFNWVKKEIPIQNVPQLQK